MLQSDFTALLTYAPEKDGGRKIPVSSGYRAAIQFSFMDARFVGEQNFIGTDLVFAGDTVSAEIALPNPEDFQGSIYVGMDFEFFEGPNLIGSGVITKIANPELGQCH